MKTKIVFHVISFLFFSVIASSEVIKNEGPVGFVTSLSGTGLVKTPSGRTIEMYLHQPIYADDEVTINGGSEAVIKWRHHDSTLTLGQQAVLKIDKTVYVSEKWNKYTDNPWMPVKAVFRFVTGQMPSSKRMPDTKKLSAYAGVRG